ncbi:hydroxymethylpyrimidine/phosphomethylpyrimidine kinase [Mesonia sp. K7]|uniref:hydroxymethylpyrimidine/phosphomethylpyrimidine kinase n=1 Tax=Mesonia sp. K7 TaxID=2218606 RepID=UPI000DA89755|nr:hydroxymethylpyrimidine/phosphomethylpyrimidine kinase [Mesonia sp. K7]PZD78107.1 hydroxymethylpyrimidine/phosphomethylpyrimidine kinase [Mesonia sp. K7]
MHRQNILTIAGFDPSSGAGITADIKVFEAYKQYGFGVCTALTVQNEATFKLCHWVDADLILEQLIIILNKHKITVVKIGIIENWELSLKVLHTLKQYNSAIKVVLDPVLKSTTNHQFIEGIAGQVFTEVLKQCFVITPNYLELLSWSKNEAVEKTVQRISHLTKVYVKGGHREDGRKGYDLLYENGTLSAEFPPTINPVFLKHGSGCVLSSALACELLKYNDFLKACEQAKYFTEKFLASNTSLLGTHY